MISFKLENGTWSGFWAQKPHFKRFLSSKAAWSSKFEHYSGPALQGRAGMMLKFWLEFSQFYQMVQYTYPNNNIHMSNHHPEQYAKNCEKCYNKHRENMLKMRIRPIAKNTKNGKTPLMNLYKWRQRCREIWKKPAKRITGRETPQYIQIRFHTSPN